MDLQFIIDHIRNRDHWASVDRQKQRIRSTGEVFTPSNLVIDYIDYCESQYPDSFVFPDNKFADSSCGDGQFLGEILIRKVMRGISFEDALTSLFGVDFQKTNVAVCRDRLLCGREDLRHIVEKNIVCADALRYHYRFDVRNDPEPYLTDGEKAERAGKLVHQPEKKKNKAKVEKVKYISTLDNLISDD